MCARDTVREPRTADRDHALEDAGIAGAFLCADSSNRDGAGDVGRAVLILPTRIEHEQITVLKLAVGVMGHAVVDDGAVRTAARNGIKRDIPQRASLCPELFQLSDHIDFGDGPRLVQPMQEAAHSDRIAEVRCSGPCDLGRVLAGLGQNAGIAPLNRIGEGFADDLRTGRWVYQNRAVERVQGWDKGVLTVNRHLGPKVIHDCISFARAGKTDAIMDHLGAEVTVHGEDAFVPALHSLDGAVLIDPTTCPQIIGETLANPVEGRDPCVLPKACKNPTEIAGARTAHLRDAVAMCRFLHWLDEAGPVTEIDVVTQLEQFRAETGALRDISFDTIAGSGPNGAVIHYRVTHDTNRQLQDGDLLVLDSGGQYQDGTTDITRTIAIGTVGAEERACYTRVLQGMIAISRARFPNGVTGAHLDSLARFPLWTAGLDFDHGTGHGVGSYLCVHEGPQRLSRVSDIPLRPGMVLSNEPGYYRAKAFGIRIENLIVVQPAPPIAGGDAHRNHLSFETLTWVPLDRRLIDPTLLSRDEVSWIDSYHATVLDKVGANLDAAAKHWLEQACAPL